MPKLNKLLRWAVVSGPVVIQTVQRYGPTLKKLVAENPEAVDKISGKLKTYQSARKKTGVEGASERIAVLKEQVNYLYGSANTPEVATQAAQWKEELKKLEVTLPLVDVMSAAQRRKQLRQVNAKIDEVSSAILSAVIQDDIEDAEVVDDN